MSLASMTGFARAQGVAGPYGWAWELKSVNAKGLDFRLRTPPGWDSVEVPVRAAVSQSLVRGNVTATLEITRTGAPPSVRVNEEVLVAALNALRAVAKRADAQPPSLDGMIGLRGVVEVVDAAES